MAVTPPELSHSIIASPEYSTAEAQAKDLKTNFLKMTEVLKEEINP